MGQKMNIKLAVKILKRAARKGGWNLHCIGMGDNRAVLVHKWNYRSMRPTPKIEITLNHKAKKVRIEGDFDPYQQTFDDWQQNMRAQENMKRYAAKVDESGVEISVDGEE